VTIMGRTVVVDDVRVGRALLDVGYGRGSGEPITSLGVFVVVSISVSGRDQSVTLVTAQAGDATYRAWDGMSSVGSAPGFGATADVVFEVPANQLAGLTLQVTPVLSMSSTIGYGVFRLPAGVSTADVVSANTRPVTEVP